MVYIGSGIYNKLLIVILPNRLFGLILNHPGHAYCQHPLSCSEHAGEGNVQRKVRVDEHHGRSAATDCQAKGARDLRERTMYFAFFFF